MIWRFLIGLAILSSACNKSKNPLFAHKFKNLNNHDVTLYQEKEFKAMVFVFLVPDCPFAQLYTMAINQVYSNYYDKGFKFYGIVPGDLYNRNEILEFKSKFNFYPELYLDKTYFLSRKYKVEVVPTVLVIDKNGKQLYFGKIDDQAIQPGQKKYQATQHYLLEALKSIENNKPILIQKTSPVGCFIE